MTGLLFDLVKKKEEEKKTCLMCYLVKRKEKRHAPCVTLQKSQRHQLATIQQLTSKSLFEIVLGLDMDFLYTCLLQFACFVCTHAMCNHVCWVKVGLICIIMLLL